MKIYYEGIFFDKNEIDRLVKDFDVGSLDKIIKNPHITFGYKPSEEDSFSEFLIGAKAEIKIIGFGNNGKNAGFLCEIPEEIKEYYHGAFPIHITTSISQDSEASYTANLNFKLLPENEQITLEGTLGFCDEKRKIHIQGIGSELDAYKLSKDDFLEK